MGGRVSSEVVELLPAGLTSATARVSSQVVEVMCWAAPPIPPRRVSSVVVELLPEAQTNAHALVSSVVVEVIVKAGGGQMMSGYWW